MAGMGGVPYSAAYNATKAAVIAISEGWSEELKDKNINVSVLCPAFVKTRIYDSERNRPEKYKLSHGESEAENSFSKKSKAMVESGIDVSIVANRVIEALLNNELYIFTHPNYRQLVQKRFMDIDDAFINSEKSPHLKDILNKKLDML
jgi:short-subunit dehydrogenase